MTAIFNARILASIAMLVFVGAVVAGATGAFFSDTETSRGNTFAAGSIDLQVDSQSHYNGNVCVPNPDDQGFVWQGTAPFPVPGTPCDGTWRQTDLGPSNLFFNFGDIKPGDDGEDTISLHVTSNSAWMCADVKVTKDDDVSTVQPELNAGDVLENPADPFDGELSKNIQFFAWLDNASSTQIHAGDNIFEENEQRLFLGFLSTTSTTTLALADSSTGGGPLVASTTAYIGLAWCAGTFSSFFPLTCDGTAMGNITQTDSMMADITLRAEQARHRPDFLCKPSPIL